MPRDENSSPKSGNQSGTRQPERPRFFYGYIIVAVSFILMMFGWGIYYIYGVFFGPLELEFHWTRAVTSGAFSLSVLISGISGIISGRLSDRIGPRAVIMFCAVFLALGYSLMFLVKDLWQFYLFYGLFIATGVGGFWAPPVSTVARWFIGRRGFMTGIVSGGISFGTLVLPPAVTALIAAYGWRAAYLIIGITILVIVMLLVRFLRHSPERVGLMPYESRQVSRIQPNPADTGFSFKEALRTSQFWMVAFIYLCFGAAQLTIMVHIVPHAVGLGYSPISAAVVLSIIGGVSLLGRIVLGSLADRLRVKISTLVGLGVLAVSLIFLQFSQNLWQLYLFGVMFGFGYGGLSCLQSLIGAELFGLGSLGVITAVFSFCFDIGGASGPVLAGYIYDLSHDYHWAFMLMIFLILLALIIGFNLKPPRKSQINSSAS